jgi:hypothetical protein
MAPYWLAIALRGQRLSAALSSPASACQVAAVNRGPLTGSQSPYEDSD